MGHDYELYEAENDTDEARKKGRKQVKERVNELRELGGMHVLYYDWGDHWTIIKQRFWGPAYRPYYLKKVEVEGEVMGYSCVWRLPDGTESDWHEHGLMTKLGAKKRRDELNDGNERRMKEAKQ